MTRTLATRKNLRFRRGSALDSTGPVLAMWSWVLFGAEIRYERILVCNRVSSPFVPQLLVSHGSGLKRGLTLGSPDGRNFRAERFYHSTIRYLGLYAGGGTMGCPLFGRALSSGMPHSVMMQPDLLTRHPSVRSFFLCSSIAGAEHLAERARDALESCWRSGWP
ncbi:hypothetical protein MRB53_037747 [Persea americana]|nr:hypothetical protein MRB53_037747 [Persea americana]